MRVPELDVRDPVLTSEACRFHELRVGHVDPDHAPGRADLTRSEEAVHPGAAAEVDDGLARTKGGQVEVVAHAGERLDRLTRNGLERGTRIAQPVGKPAAGFEMKVLVRFV